MRFEQLPTLRSDKKIVAAQQELERISTQLQIEPGLLAPIKAVFLWKEVLTRSSAEEQGLLLSYLEQTGAIPARGIRSPIQVRPLDPAPIESACLSLVNGFLTQESSPHRIIEQDAVSFKVEHPDLSTSSIQLLQHMIRHQLDLSSLDVAPLNVQIPFPLMQHNYFGRFICKGAENPAQAVRHLHVAMPFLIRMRSLIEGLQNKKLHHLLLLVESQSALEVLEAAPKSKKPELVTKEEKLDALSIVHAVIQQSMDLYGGKEETKFRPLTCVQIPSLPDVSTHQFDQAERLHVSTAIFDWLLFGTENSLLDRKSLSASQQRTVDNTLKILAERQSALEALSPPQRHDPEFDSKLRAFKRMERKLTNGIERCETLLDELANEEANLVSIREQLEAAPGLVPALRKFRREITQALEHEHRIVFTFFGSTQSENPGSVVSLLDIAMTNRHRKSVNSPAINLLAASPILLSMGAHKQITLGRTESPKSMLETSIRPFAINVDEINQSVRYLFSGLMPGREDPNLEILLETICGEMDLPGVQNPEQLISLVKQATGRRKPTAGHYVEYVFERAPEITTAQLFSLLVTLHKIGVSTISARTHELSRERFKHPKRTLPMFETFASGYQPNQLGSAPEIFEDLSSFQKYLAFDLDALGMTPELKQLEHHLETRGIVAIVDGTNYHPELDSEVGATGDRLKKEDAEQTTEVWGEYVRPSERLVRAFSLRLMEGDVPSSLKHSSLMGIVRPDKADKVMQLIVKKFYGIDIDISPNLSTINQLLSDLKLFDDKAILVIDAHSISDLEQYREFLQYIERYQIKIILRTREPFPGVPQVNIQPFLDTSVSTRVMADSNRLQTQLELDQPIELDVIQFATQQVMNCRTPQADPLNLTLQVLNSAAAHARLYPDRAVCRQDVVSALPSIFHLPDGEQMRLRLDAIDSFLEHAPLQVLGQEKAIRTIGDRVRNHILGMRDPTRPLTLLLPGPTGVGKTELMMHFARICDIPFFMVEGAEFSEEHTVSRLVGSPSGYVGPEEGIMYTFLKENTSGLIFIDEIEKMHPSVYQALMNFFDKATLTAGNGKTISRPGFIIAGASNAGASKLTREMDMRTVKEILSESFVDRFGNPRPELVRRFEPIVMHAIEEAAFKDMLRRSLSSIANRPGFVTANLDLVDFDDASAELLYKAARDVCAYSEKNTTFGFHNQVIEPAASDELYYDMRHVSRALDDLAGRSLQQIAIEQYKSGEYLRRGTTRKVRLVGDTDTGKIKVEDFS